MSSFVVLGYKLRLFAWTWIAALAVSYFLRFLGVHYFESFVIRPFIVFGLLFGPTIILSFYLALILRQLRL